MIKQMNNLLYPKSWKIADCKVKQSYVHMQKGQHMDWGLKSFGIPNCWLQSRGKGVTIAVLDTGIDHSHKDLKGQILAVKDFTGDGTHDAVGHGTHCAGIIAATDNAEGVVGVAPEAKLLSGKVLNDKGQGRINWIADGIRWAVDLGADIISMSLGGPSGHPVMEEAVQYALDNGVIVVAAAGNSGEGQNTIGYPGGYDDVITVGSVAPDLQRSDFSSTGPTIEIMAPGEGVLSTTPKDSYARFSGTSMACPFVAGAIALLISSTTSDEVDPFWTPENVAIALCMTARDVEDEGFDNETGWGLINPKKSMEYDKG